MKYVASVVIVLDLVLVAVCLVFAAASIIRQWPSHLLLGSLVAAAFVGLNYWYASKYYDNAKDRYE